MLGQNTGVLSSSDEQAIDPAWEHWGGSYDGNIHCLQMGSRCTSSRKTKKSQTKKKPKVMAITDLLAASDGLHTAPRQPGVAPTLRVFATD